MKILLLFSAIFLSVHACNDNKGQGTDTPEGAITLGDTIKLYYQESLAFDANTKISFTDLKDSRCPKGTNCIQEGKATATITLDQKEGDAKSIKMTAKGMCYNDTDGCGSSKKVAGHKVMLYNIYPYPEGGGVRDLKKSYLKLVITK